MIEENVQVRVIGQQDRLPTHTRRAMEKAMEETKENTGLILNFALNYGSRDEIVSAVQHMMKDREEGKVRVEDVSEEMLSSYLMTSSLPDPELLIRTSGELRISNFMLWQIAYSEFWFTDVYWPDFTEEHLLNAITDFQHRGRRFGMCRKRGFGSETENYYWSGCCRAIHSHRNLRWRAFTVLVYALASIGLYELIRMNKLTLISVPTVLAAVLLWIILIPSSASELFTWIGLGKLEITFVIVLLLYHIQSFLRIHLLLTMLHFY